MEGDPLASLWERNIRLFMLFRLLFSARFYYPVFTILFLDYGLTLEQFALMNLVWAVTIVLAEVPSGALADLFGRRRLVVAASLLMILEMALLAFVPLGASMLLFWVFIANRIVSGLAEAAASGADEALAYDSLVLLGREDSWAKVLERTTRMVSVGFFVAMISGALAYDGALINSILGGINESWQLERERIIRLPVYLTLCTAVLAFFVAYGMRETPPVVEDETAPQGQPLATVQNMGTWLRVVKQSLVRPFVQIAEATRWTLGHAFVLMVILSALVLDSVPRQLIILASEYYRMIGIPTAWFGLIGASISLLGVATAILSRWMVTHCRPFTNFLLLSGLLMFGLLGVTQMVPIYGVLFAVCAFMLLSMVNFQASYYLNREVSRRHRATVLSLKGLAFNLGLGIASFVYMLWIIALKAHAESGLTDTALKEMVFVQSLKGFPVYFAVLFIAVLVLTLRGVGSPQWLSRSRPAPHGGAGMTK